MSILSFQQALIGGGARSNQFRVTLSFPNFVNGTAAANNAQFLCDATSLPGQNIGIAPVMYRGRAVKLAGERQFDNWSVTCINDVDFGIMNAFEAWMENINAKIENTGLINPNVYTTNLQVEQLDRNGTTLKMYVMSDCWPISVSPVALSFGDNDSVQRFTVDFAVGFFKATAFLNGAPTLNTAAGTL